MKHLSSAGKHSRSRSVVQRPPAIRIGCRFGVTAEQVFDAWLDPDVAGRWLFATASRPMTHVEIDARVGGSFRFAEQQRGGERVEHTGEYVEIVPPRRLVFTVSLADHWYVTTRVTVEIAPLRSGCELALLHEDVPPHYADHTEGRWTGILYGLGIVLESHAAVAGR